MKKLTPKQKELVTLVAIKLMPEEKAPRSLGDIAFYIMSGWLRAWLKTSQQGLEKTLTDEEWVLLLEDIRRMTEE
jgi:hypothetical protein